MKRNYQEINAETWDRWAKEGCAWSIPVSHKIYLQALQGEWGIYLTPTVIVPHAWFGELEGAKVLGLASGGGQQMPVLTALGAVCTVFDNSDSQLDAERIVSEREKYAIEIIKGDMTKKLPFADESFDLIFHPVSNCYIEDVNHVWRECFRVLKQGGILLAGFDNGFNFLFNDYYTLPLTVVNKLPFNPLQSDDETYERLAKGDDGIQFSHSLEEQIGGQLQAGFILTALYEDRDREGDGVIRDYFPQYMATRAVKK